MLWFQAAGNTRGQSWTGVFRDDNKNGILEFADAEDAVQDQAAGRTRSTSWPGSPTRRSGCPICRPGHGFVFPCNGANRTIRHTIWTEARKTTT